MGICRSWSEKSGGPKAHYKKVGFTGPRNTVTSRIWSEMPTRISGGADHKQCSVQENSYAITFKAILSSRPRLASY